MAVRNLRRRLRNLMAGRTESVFPDDAGRGGRRQLPSGPQRLVAGVALLGSKSFVEYSTSGLENPLVNRWLV
jgi:hypothetical protein